MSLPRFLPWQESLAGTWLSQRERFAHAWLIHGLAGIGKVDFALAAAASLLCESPQNGLACGGCPACTWVAGGNHPDLRRIRPDAVAVEEGADADADGASGDAAASAGSKRAPSKDIRIEQIRSLESWFNTATHRGGWRVAVLYPAHAMNAVSANALLKVLEEPPAHTVFLLVADAPDRLLPTLVSRCRRLPLPAPDVDTAEAWLRQQDISDPGSWLAAAGGAPLAALRLAQSREQACPSWLDSLITNLARGDIDLGALTESIEKTAAAEWLDALQRLFVDLMLAQTGAPVRYFPGQAAALQSIAQRSRAAPLAETGRWLTQQRALANHPLSPKLFIHSALQRVAASCRH